MSTPENIKRLFAEYMGEGTLGDAIDKNDSAHIRDRLEYLRGEIEAERISYSEIAELQGLAEHIDPSDVQLLEWAGVPEFPDDEPMPTCDICGEPMICDRGEDCTVHAGDWNGETGNHLSCERVACRTARS